MVTDNMQQQFGVLRGYPLNTFSNGSPWVENSVYSLSAKRYPLMGYHPNLMEAGPKNVFQEPRPNNCTVEGPWTVTTVGNHKKNPFPASKKRRPGARASNASTYTFEPEDETLRDLVKRHGTKKWHIISAKMNKSPLECKQRWDMYLQMCMNKSGWTAKEDCLLLEGHNKFGNRWTEIAKLVPGRTDNAVKNRYHALYKKRFGKANMSKPADTAALNESESKDMEPPAKRAKFSSAMIKNREEKCSKPVSLNRTCAKQSLPIQIPEDINVNYVQDPSMAPLCNANATDPPVVQEIEDLGFEIPCSDFQVDVEEVMGWLLAQTPTSSQTAVSNEFVSPGIPTCFDTERFNFLDELNFASISSQQFESAEIF